MIVMKTLLKMSMKLLLMMKWTMKTKMEMKAVLKATMEEFARVKGVNEDYDDKWIMNMKDEVDIDEFDLDRN